MLNEHSHQVNLHPPCSVDNIPAGTETPICGFWLFDQPTESKQGRSCQPREPLDTLCRVFRERSPPVVFMEGTGAGLGRINARAASRQELFSRLAYSHIGGIITQGSRVLRG